MALHVKKSTGWAIATNFYVKNATGWKSISKAYVKKSTGWRKFWPKSGPEIDSPLIISANGTVHDVILTGTNYHWDGGDTFSYIFQSASSDSINDIDWTDIGTYQTILNPDLGLSNTKTYTTLIEDFDILKSTMWFRFRVKAVDTINDDTSYEASPGVEITVKPINKTAPVATPSTAVAGVGTFTTTNGTWDYDPKTYSYQWKYKDSGGVYRSIVGATSITYSPPELVGGISFLEAYGSDLRCFVKAKNTVDSLEKESNIVTVVAPDKTITWNANGGSVTPSSSTVPYPYSVTTPKPTRANYAFNGWYSTQTGGNYMYGPIAAEVPWTIPVDVTTMYARWTLIPKNINTVAPTITPTSGTEGVTTFSVSSNGTWTGSPSPISYSYLWEYNNGGLGWSAASAPNDQASYTPGAGYVSLFGTSLRCSVTAYNGTNSDPAGSNTATIQSSTRTVNWLPNQGTVSVPSSTGNYPSFDITTPTPTRSGYTFNGWYDTTSGSYTYTIGAGVPWNIPYDGINMTARWTIIPVPVNTVAPAVIPTTGTAGVTEYSSNTGTWTGPSISYSYLWKYRDSGSNYVSLPSPSGIGYATSSTYVPPSNYVSTYGTILRCVVTATNGGGSASADSNDVLVESPTRTVYWSVANGGSVSTPSSLTTSPYSVTTPTPTRANYDFIGWYDTQTGSYTYGGPTNGAAGVTFTVPYDGITMYARWTAKTVGAASISITGVNTGGFTASWSASNAVTYFVDIFRTSNAVSITGYPKTNTTLTTSGAITGLPEGVQYTVQVYGKNIEGTAGTQAVQNVTTSVTPPPTCTPTCGSWSYTYGDWSAWSTCSGGTQSRSRTVSGTRTCTASNCSTYTETSSSTETQSQSCTDPGGNTCTACPQYTATSAACANCTSCVNQGGFWDGSMCLI